jgi:hypothetical protein
MKRLPRITVYPKAFSFFAEAFNKAMALLEGQTNLTSNDGSVAIVTADGNTDLSIKDALDRIEALEEQMAALSGRLDTLETLLDGYAAESITLCTPSGNVTGLILFKPDAP